jgi:F1F0 ATPase subunit 2
MTGSAPSMTAYGAAGLAVGLALGILHYFSLWWNTRLFAAGAAGKAIALQLGRIAVAVAVLVMLARLSLIALFAGALGLLVARPLVIWYVGDKR